MPTCNDCKHFDMYDDCPPLDEVMNESDTIGSCKRYPPVLVDASRPSWRLAWESPTVSSSDHCGEWCERHNVL